MKRGKVLLLAVASFFILSSSTVFADGNVWWETLSQAQRNQQIINWAWMYNGQYGGTCKEWVQLSVVKPASNGHVMLPLNNDPPNDYYWQQDPYGHAIWMNIPIESAQMGNVVQMHMRNSNTPHTAIVWSIDSSGVTFIESNLNFDGMVRIRSKISFATFKAQVAGYTVYPIH